MSTTHISHEFSSSDSRFRVVITPGAIASILRFAANANRSETGGILLGRYNSRHDSAFIDGVTGPPDDSAAGRSWFRRGVNGLRDLLTRLWNGERRFYLGEWHYHPGGSPVPSSTDAEQMKSIAGDPSYACPEPVLVIFGGDPSGNWDVGVIVYRRNDSTIPLTKRTS